jgi:hypothetical protein
MSRDQLICWNNFRLIVLPPTELLICCTSLNFASSPNSFKYLFILTFEIEGGKEFSVKPLVLSNNIFYRFMYRYNYRLSCFLCLNLDEVTMYVLAAMALKSENRRPVQHPTRKRSLTRSNRVFLDRSSFHSSFNCSVFK